jgi:hypothetical protein
MVPVFGSISSGPVVDIAALGGGMFVRMQTGRKITDKG